MGGGEGLVGFVQEGGVGCVVGHGVGGVGVGRGELMVGVVDGGGNSGAWATGLEWVKCSEVVAVNDGVGCWRFWLLIEAEMSHGMDRCFLPGLLDAGFQDYDRVKHG